MRLTFKEKLFSGRRVVVPCVAETGEEIEGVTACSVHFDVHDPTRMKIDVIDANSLRYSTAPGEKPK